MSPDGLGRASHTLTEGFSPHEWEDVKVDLVATDPVLAEAAAGCWYRVVASEGEGNGHQINVEGLVLRLAGDIPPVCVGCVAGSASQNHAVRAGAAR